MKDYSSLYIVYRADKTNGQLFFGYEVENDLHRLERGIEALDYIKEKYSGEPHCITIVHTSSGKSIPWVFVAENWYFNTLEYCLLKAENARELHNMMIAYKLDEYLDGHWSDGGIDGQYGEFGGVGFGIKEVQFSKRT